MATCKKEKQKTWSFCDTRQLRCLNFGRKNPMDEPVGHYCITKSQEVCECACHSRKNFRSPGSTPTISKTYFCKLFQVREISTDKVYTMLNCTRWFIALLQIGVTENYISIPTTAKYFSIFIAFRIQRISNFFLYLGRLVYDSKGKQYNYGGQMTSSLC